MKKNNVALSLRDVVLVFFALFFVLFGAYDLLSRFFISDPKPQALLEAGATTSPAVYAVPFVPERLRISALSVDAAVERVGLKPDGDMKAPSRFDTTAWYEGGSHPGEAGNTVIAGHVNNALDTTGVFEHLDQLNLGDTIVVSGEGREATYVVRQMTVYDAATAPKELVFARSGLSRLVLITCDGAWDQGKRSYDKRLVIYADLVSSR